MVAKRKPPKDDGTPGDMEIVKWSKGDLSYRGLLILLVLSATPMGKVMMLNMGIQPPEVASTTKLHQDVHQMQYDVLTIKDDLRLISDRLSKLEKRP